MLVTQMLDIASICLRRFLGHVIFLSSLAAVKSVSIMFEHMVHTGE